MRRHTRTNSIGKARLCTHTHTHTHTLHYCRCVHYWRAKFNYSIIITIKYAHIASLIGRRFRFSGRQYCTRWKWRRGPKLVMEDVEKYWLLGGASQKEAASETVPFLHLLLATLPFSLFLSSLSQSLLYSHLMTKTIINEWYATKLLN